MRSGASFLTSSDGRAAARQAAEVLGTLRGLAAKVGQMASYVDGLVPEEQRDAYEAALRALRAAAPTSSPEAIRRLLEEDLGAPLPALSPRWEDQPFASASLGQVHRARLPDGREVAVKVQHPGIAEALESDLRNAATLEGFASALGGRRLNPRALREGALAFLRGCFTPLFDPPYRVTRAFVAGLVAQMRSLTLQALTTPPGEFFSLPPEMPFMNRLQFGFYSVLARLVSDVAVDHAGVDRGFFHLVDGPQAQQGRRSHGG